MSEQQARLEYESLLKEGELKKMFPSMTGKWVKDKEKFLQLHQANLDLLNMDVIIEDEDFDLDYEEGTYSI